MLSDSIRQMRIHFSQELPAGTTGGLDIMLRAYELEIRNMEERILFLTGREHVPLDGRLVSDGTPLIELGGVYVRAS